MGLWLAAPRAAHGGAELLSPCSHMHAGSRPPLFPVREGSSSALPQHLAHLPRTSHPSPSPPPRARGPGAIQALLEVRKAPSRQVTQGEGRVQTSCGRSLQPAPALALAFLQTDINARHREVVRALVRLNEVPARQAASQECPRLPSSFKDAKKSLLGRATAS